MNIPRFLQLLQGRPSGGRVRIGDHGQPAAGFHRPRLPASLREPLPPADRGRADQHARGASLHRRFHPAVGPVRRDGGQDRRQAACRRPGKRIAVVGAGPAGLTAAFYLALLGHEVTVYESHAEPGGMLRFALPEYRLPRDVLDREIEMIRRLGVKFVFNSPYRCGYRAERPGRAVRRGVPVASAPGRKRRSASPGTELAGVFGALHFLEGEAHDKRTDLGERVVIIGGGNAAIDCARTAVRKGCVGDRHLPPRAQGHARHRGRSRCGRGRGRELPVPGLAASHCRRATATSRPSRSPRRVSARSTRRAADARSTPARCRPSVQHRHPGGGRRRGQRILPRVRPAPPSQAACSTWIATP